MSFMKIFRKDPILYKQPQENYCSNKLCLNETAIVTGWYNLLNDEGVQYASHYCINCITERKFK